MPASTASAEFARRFRAREPLVGYWVVLDAPAATERLAAAVTSIRVLYPDLHGIARGKDVPVSEFDHAIAHGLCFCAAVMGTDLRHTPVVGGDEGYPDLIARPDMDTLVTLPQHERKGAGSMLVRWGTQRADEAGVEAYLEASPMGAPMYARHGFEPMKKVALDLTKYEGEEVLEFIVSTDLTDSETY